MAFRAPIASEIKAKFPGSHLASVAYPGIVPRRTSVLFLRALQADRPHSGIAARERMTRMPRSNRRTFTRSLPVSRLGALIAACGLAAGSVEAQTWTKITRNPVAAVNLMLQLSDGTVLCSQQNGSTIGKAWYKLTPDSTGSYVNGTWTILAASNDTRLYFSSQVLRDGRVFVAGGEYGTGGPKAEIYNPQTNVWTSLVVPTTILDPSVNSPVIGSAQTFFDANSEILPDGSVIIMPVGPKTSGIPVIYNPSTNAWSNAGKLFRGSYQDEATWVKLPDSTFITIDPFGTNSERYNPATNTWINDTTVPVSLYDSFGSELGGGLLLPNGKAFYLGSTGKTAIYTPSGSVAAGSWSAGPNIPSVGTQALGTPDAPCAMLVTGNILFIASPVPTSANHFPSPAYFYEYNYITNSYTAVNGPNGTSNDPISTYIGAMLALADGTTLYSHMGTDVYSYRPSGSPIAAAKPTISSVSDNGDGTFHLVGLQLNGICEGASYGDDLQMNSNYPLVRVSDGAGHNVYGRTFNWSSTGVRTGATPVSTEFTLPTTGLTGTTRSLVVVANGVASDAITSPVVTSDPANASVAAGQSATFTVVASGFGPLVYQWFQGATSLSESGEFSGTNTATLTINPAGAGDVSSDYHCVVTNFLGSATSGSASLTLTAASCYANCDNSTDSPVLTASDFTCFLTKFRSGDPYANCDGSTDAPVLTASDFTCFLTAFRAGCP
jgi:hypothetical protein